LGRSWREGWYVRGPFLEFCSACLRGSRCRWRHPAPSQRCHGSAPVSAARWPSGRGWGGRMRQNTARESIVVLLSNNLESKRKQMKTSRQKTVGPIARQRHIKGAWRTRSLLYFAKRRFRSSSLRNIKRFWKRLRSEGVSPKSAAPAIPTARDGGRRCATAGWETP